MLLFDEERKVLKKLLDEWYKDVKAITEDANVIFSAKGKMYDRESPVWKRMKWPWGFMQEISKKANRVEQMLSADGPDWDEIEEELIDILNYCRMFAGVTRMVRRREEE